MSEDYKSAILQHFSDVLQGSIEISPNYQTMLLIIDALNKRGIERKLAERVVTRMQIVVDDALWEDQQFMTRVVEQFSDVVFRVYTFACGAFTDSEAFINLTEGMSLTLVPPQ